MAPTDDKMDRISELPRNVIDCIFEGMSIREAVRTSILSRNWRYTWASFPQLVFDKKFFKEIERKHKRVIQYEFPKAINKVFFVHNGPIIECFLHIPNIPYDLSSEIDQWMLYLSRNGIEELELENTNPTPYIMPSCILLCRSLIELKLLNCVLKPPHNFEGFHYIVKLFLTKVSFSASVSKSLLHNLQVLRTLMIGYCTGIDQTNIYAPILEYACMVDNDKVDWQWFKSSKHLRALQIQLGKEVRTNGCTINMIEFLKIIPQIRTLWLDGFSLKYLAAGDLSKSLATPMLQHAPALFCTNIRLCDLGVGDHDQILSMLCLLKSCPKLEILILMFDASAANGIEPVTDYVESLNSMDISLDMLQTVNIEFMKGLKAELVLIKLLLFRSTCLKRMTIQLSSGMSASDGFNISRELLEFPRTSSSAKIIYMDPPCS